MAQEILTLESLQNALKDCATLSDVVNGTTSKDVLSRLGSTYPNLYKALMLMMQAGGAKAYLTSTELLADQPTEKNVLGIDLKTFGYYYWNGTVWTKSTTQPLERTKTIANNAAITSTAIALRSGLGSEIAENAFTQAGYINYDGSLISSAGDLSTDLISVKKGDCFLIFCPSNYISLSIFAYMYDANGNALGALSRTRLSSMSTAYISDADRRDSVLSLCELKRDFTKHYIIPVRAPQDGFIRFSKPQKVFLTENLATYGTFGEYSLWKVPYKTFINAPISVLPPDVLQQFEDVFYSACQDISVVDAGYQGRANAGTSQFPGQPVAYSGVTGGSEDTVSKRIAVKAGQYVHYTGGSYSNYLTLIFEDASGNYLGTYQQNNVWNPWKSAQYGPTAGLNIQSQYTGYVRIAHQQANTWLTALGVTDQPIQYAVPYATKYSKAEPLRGLLLTANRLPSFYVSANLKPTVANGFNLTNSATDTHSRALKPIVLKSGQVLKFSTKACDPCIGYYAEYGTDKLTTNCGQLISTDMITENIQESFLTFTDTAITGTAPTQWWAEGEVTVFLYNATKDLVVYLNTGGSMSKQDIEIMSVDEYKAFRTSYLKNLKTGAGYYNMTGGSLLSRDRTYSPFLVFKGEVVCQIGADDRFNLCSQDFQTIADSTNYSTNAFVGIGANRDEALVESNGKYVLGQNIRYKHNVATTDGIVCGNSMFWRKDVPNNTFIGKLKLPMIALNQQYPTQVLNRANYKPQNYEPPKASFRRYGYNVASATPSYLSHANVGADWESYIFPLLKDRFYRIETNTSGWQPASDLAIFNTETGSVSYPYMYDSDGNVLTGYVLQPKAFYIKATADCMLFFNAYTAAVDGVTDQLRTSATVWYSPSCSEISEDEYLKNVGLSTDTFLSLPHCHGLKLNIIDGHLPADMTKVVSTVAKVQFLLGDKLLATLGCNLTINGNGSATTLKSNLKMKFFNKDGKSVFVKVGDWRASSTLVLKTFGTEKSNVRENFANDLWRSMRYNDTYPKNLILDIPKLLADSKTDDYFDGAVCSTQALPVQYFVGNKVMGIATLRTQLKRDAWAMKKANSNQILAIMDWWLMHKDVSMVNFNLAQWEITTPEMSGYVAGDTALPNTDVQTKLQRLMDWFKSVSDGTVNMADTYADYIDLNSWLDFILFSEATGNWDGIGNNSSIGTWDGKVWHIFTYDLDGILGYGGRSASTIYTQKDVFNLFYKYMPDALKARYAVHKNARILTVSNMYQLMTQYSQYFTPEQREADAAMWGTNDQASMKYMLSWIVQHFDVMEKLYT